MDARIEVRVNASAMGTYDYITLRVNGQTMLGFPSDSAFDEFAANMTHAANNITRHTCR